MNYYFALLFVFLAGFFLTEVVKSIRHKRKVVVVIKHLDGSISKAVIHKGRDVEVDALIEKARSRKERTV